MMMPKGQCLGRLLLIICHRPVPPMSRPTSNILRPVPSISHSHVCCVQASQCRQNALLGRLCAGVRRATRDIEHPRQCGTSSPGGSGHRTYDSCLVRCPSRRWVCYVLSVASASCVLPATAPAPAPAPSDSRRCQFRKLSAVSTSKGTHKLEDIRFADPRIRRSLA